jgi:hypothetical protein
MKGRITISLALLAFDPRQALAATSAPGPFHCFGERATIVGTTGDNRLRGTGQTDVIVARGGHDIVFGRGGADRILGKGTYPGNYEYAFGGPGSDRMRGGEGAQVLNAKRGS